MEKPKPLPRSLKSPSPASAEKPIPLPRKTRIGQTQSQSQAQEDPLLTAVPDAPALLRRNLGDEGKRGTINIFQVASNLQDPFTDFDAEFVPKEEEIRAEAALDLRRITFTSPLSDVEEDSLSWKRISSISSSDSEHYMEPPPPRQVPKKGREHVPLGKVVSCPPLAKEEDEEYEPVAPLETNVNASFHHLPATAVPGGTSMDFLENKRVTVAAIPGASCSTNSNGIEERVLRSLKKVHEYDEVAMEDGTVVFLDNMENLAAISNNNSSNSSSTSRNSLIAEFDPLTAPSSSFVSNIETDVTKINNLNKTNNNEDHRYDYIDSSTDGEGEDQCRSARSSCSNSTNRSSISESNSFVFSTQGFENPEYSANSAEKTPSSGSDSSPVQEDYEPIAGPASASGPPLPPLNNRVGSLISQEPSTAPPAVPTSSTSFFRRFSSKFRLNSIKEEVLPSLTSSVTCHKCGLEHPEGQKSCRWSPPFRESVVFSTNLYKSGVGLGRKDWNQKRVVLAKGRLSFYNEKKELISDLPMDKAVVIAKKAVEDKNNGNLFFFELFFVNWKSTSLILGAADETERANWMGKYIEAMTTAIPPVVRSQFDRGGWAFLKETVTADWRPGWVLLQDKERTLVFAYHDCQEYVQFDLRKARCIELSNKEDEQRCPFVENTDVLTLDLCSRILYITTPSAKITSTWEREIRASATKNGKTFSEMQLTLDNVPVIVDKCIDFLYAHGTLAEGIYRQSGSNTRIAQLLQDFQKDAWSVQINVKEFSAHDVAGTLKRFFRTLPEPLVTAGLYERWIKVASIPSYPRKTSEYQSLLQALPPINLAIMKKLICHLYAVHELHEKNLMPLINLAPIWGPTLMSVDNGSTTGFSYDSACAECEVIKDLIEGYYTLFQVEEEEREKERKMQSALETFHLGSLRRKCSGDIKIWIYLWEKDESSALNVTLTPNSTASGIVSQLLSGRGTVRNVEEMGLHEVICGGTLERVLHPSEKVVDTVLRWSLWDVQDRKDNYFVIRKNLLYPRLVQYAKEPHMLGSEVKFADSKSKSFKKVTLQFSQATLKVFKDSKCTAEQASWKIEDIVWYMGCEPKRTAPSKFTFTFSNKTYHFTRSKDEPYFGWVVGCGSEEELHRWLGALLQGEHPEGPYPAVVL